MVAFVTRRSACTDDFGHKALPSISVDCLPSRSVIVCCVGDSNFLELWMSSNWPAERPSGIFFRGNIFASPG